LYATTRFIWPGGNPGRCDLNYFFLFYLFFLIFYFFSFYHPTHRGEKRQTEYDPAEPGSDCRLGEPDEREGRGGGLVHARVNTPPSRRRGEGRRNCCSPTWSPRGASEVGKAVARRGKCTRTPSTVRFGRSGPDGFGARERRTGGKRRTRTPRDREGTACFRQPRPVRAPGGSGDRGPQRENIRRSMVGQLRRR